VASVATTRTLIHRTGTESGRRSQRLLTTSKATRFLLPKNAEGPTGDETGYGAIDGSVVTALDDSSRDDGGYPRPSEASAGIGAAGHRVEQRSGLSLDGAQDGQKWP